MTSFLKGLLIGFSIAAPVGPIGLLCIRRSITQGRAAGFVSGLGAATADAVYGMIAAAGLTAVTAFLLEYQTWLQIGGGLFLVYLGVTTLRAPAPASAAQTRAAGTLGGAYGSTFALTLTNPMTIVAFVGILAGAGVGAGSGIAASAALVSGVFTGSAFWWLILSGGASWLGARLERGGLRVVNLGAGLVIVAFGLWQIVVAAKTRI